MKSTVSSICRRLAVLGLTFALSVPALAAGMSAFVPKTEYPGFSDVRAGAWYNADVEKAVTLGLMKGKGEGKFDPQGRLSVAEAITMAVQVHAAYTGQPFTPGGSPWYQNAVTYALENGLVLRGEFSDYTASTTRAEMAGLFAYALPTGELTRINRVATLADVTAETTYADAIYFLYSAGVLSGTGDGSFQPSASIDRASAAALLNRVALPQRRVTSVPSAPDTGTVVESPDGAFRFPSNLGNFQPIQENGATGITSSGPSGTLTALSYGKDSQTATTLSTFAVERLTALRDKLGGLEVLIQPDFVLFRGLNAISFRYTAQGQIHTVFCLENTGAYVTLTLTHSNGTQASEQYAQLMQMAFTLDLNL